MKSIVAPWKRELWYYVHYFLRRFSATIFMLPFLIFNYGENSFLLYFSIFLIAFMYDVIVTPHAYDLKIDAQDFVQCVIEKKPIPFVGSMATRKEYFWALIYIYIGLLLLVLVCTITDTPEDIAITYITVLSVTCAMLTMAYFSFFGPLSLSKKRKGRLFTWENLGSPMGGYLGKRRFFQSLFLLISETFGLLLVALMYALCFITAVASSDALSPSHWLNITMPIIGSLLCSGILIGYNNKFSWFKFITINNEIHRKL